MDKQTRIIHIYEFIPFLYPTMSSEYPIKMIDH